MGRGTLLKPGFLGPGVALLSECCVPSFPMLIFEWQPAAAGLTPRQ